MEPPDPEAVSLVHWPDQASERRRAETDGRPRLLLVAPESRVPHVEDPLEDWIRLPAPETDVRARVITLAIRAAEQEVPTIDGQAILRFRGQWVALSPVEADLARTLAARSGVVVGREALMRAAWPETRPSRNALDVHVLRLRRRLAPLGLAIKTVRSRGYLLENAPLERGEVPRPAERGRPVVGGEGVQEERQKHDAIP